MEQNHIINEVNSIIISSEKGTINEISLIEYISLFEQIKKEITKICKETIKKINSNLSKNTTFFDRVVTSLVVDEQIHLTLECNIIREKLLIDKESLTIITKMKNQELFQKLIRKDLIDLLNTLEQYNFLKKITINSSFKILNINITNAAVELFAYKSPTWITMGKSFSLKYNFSSKKYQYEIDHVNLKENLKNQEKFLFNKVRFNLQLLPLEMLNKYHYYKNKEEKTLVSENKLSKIINKFLNLLKKN